MAILTDSSGTIFRPYTYALEKDFEAVVVSLSDQIFGASSIYVDVKRRVKGAVTTIPDGYVIDMTEVDEPKLYIIENEIKTHDAFKHVGIQLLKFVTSFEDAKTSVRNFLMAEIEKNVAHVERLNAHCKKSNSRNIDNYLDEAVYGAFRGVVVIDEATPELHKVLRNIRANISVLELKTYISDANEMIHQFDTLYDEFEDQPIEASGRSTSAAEREAQRERRAASDTIVVPAREDGFKQVFLGENRWYAIRIGAAMKERIKYIAAYQVAPVSAITHLAEIEDILPYEDTGKYEVVFKGPAQEIQTVKLVDPKNSPQGPVYCKRADLLEAKTVGQILS